MAAVAAQKVGHNRRASGSYDVDFDAQLAGSLREQATNVDGGAEPELAPVSKARNERFCDKQPGATEAGGDDGGLIEEWSGVEHLDHFRVGMAHTVLACWAELTESL